jgi:hypothetical protein
MKYRSRIDISHSCHIKRRITIFHPVDIETHIHAPFEREYDVGQVGRWNIGAEQHARISGSGVIDQKRIVIGR